MQNIYIGSQQIHSNNEDIGFAVEIPIEGFEFPSIRLGEYEKPGEHGGIITNQFYGARPFAFNGRVSGDSIAQYEANKRLLARALSIQQNSLAVAQPILVRFLTMDNLALQIYAYAKDGNPLTLKTKSLNHAAFRIEMTAPDFRFYGQSLQVATINVPTGGGVTYPVIYPVTYAPQVGGSVTVTNNGDVASFPVITFNGPLTTPYINNLSTGQVFIVNKTIDSGESIVVDMANHTMVLNGSRNALQYFNDNNAWLYLRPTTNLLKLGTSLTSDTGNAQVAYRDAYLIA